MFIQILNEMGLIQKGVIQFSKINHLQLHKIIDKSLNLLQASVIFLNQKQYNKEYFTFFFYFLYNIKDLKDNLQFLTIQTNGDLKDLEILNLLDQQILVQFSNDKEFLKNFKKNIHKFRNEEKIFATKILSVFKDANRLSIKNLHALNSLYTENQQLIDVFVKNVQEYQSKSGFFASKKQLEGVDFKILKSLKKNNKYWVSFYDTVDVASTCKNEKIRKRASNLLFFNGFKKNDSISDKIRANLHKIAKYHKYDTYLDKVLSSSVFKDVYELKKVYRNIQKKIEPKMQKELEQLSFFANEWGKKINFEKHNELYLKKLYTKNIIDVDIEKIEYSITKKNVLKAVNYVLKKYFNCEFRLKYKRKYEVYEFLYNKKIVGYIYGDFKNNERPNNFEMRIIQAKTNHCPFHIYMSLKLNEKNIFLDDVQNTFHEFGHVLSEALSKNKEIFCHGLSIDNEFSEFSSLLMEKFLYNEDVLRILLPTQHYKYILKIQHNQKDFASLEEAQDLKTAFFDTLIYSEPKTSLKKALKKTQKNFSTFKNDNDKMHRYIDHLFDGEYSGLYFQYPISKFYAKRVFEILESKSFTPNVMNKMRKKLYEDITIKDNNVLEQFNNFIKIL